MQEPRDLRGKRVASGAPGEGPRRDPRVVTAPSAGALSRDLGAQIRGSGEGTYLVVYGGPRQTGGYSVGVAGARVEGDRVTVRISLEDPPPDAIVTQSLSYPYEISVLRGLSAEARVSPSWTGRAGSSTGRFGRSENSGPWGAFGLYV
jgi:hypothetical protein